MPRDQCFWGPPYGGQIQRGKAPTLALERAQKLLSRFTTDSWHNLSVEVEIPPHPNLMGWMYERSPSNPGQDLSNEDLAALSELVEIPADVAALAKSMPAVELQVALDEAGAGLLMKAVQTRRGPALDVNTWVEAATALVRDHEDVTVYAHARIEGWLGADGTRLPDQDSGLYSKKQWRCGGMITAYAPRKAVLLNATLPFEGPSDAFFAWIASVKQHTGLNLTTTGWRRLTPGGGIRKIKW